MKLFRYIGFILILLTSCSHLKEAKESYNTGNYNVTIKMCKTALDADSTDQSALQLLGNAYFATQQIDSSIWAFQKLLTLNPGNKPAVEKLTMAFTKKGDNAITDNKYYDAVKFYEQALALNAEDNVLIEKIGDAYLKAGRQDKAKSWYSKLLTGADSSSISLKLSSLESFQNKAQHYLDEGLKLLQKKNYSKAQKQFERSLELKPDFKDAKYYLYMVTGIQLYRKGGNKGVWDAIEAFGYASSLFQQKGEPHYYMALAYNKKDRNEYVNAISELELAIQMEPNGEYLKQSQKMLAEIKARRKKMQDFLSQ